MGTGIIIENNISRACQTLWQKAPTIPEWTADLTKYNRPFINLCSLIGAYTLYKSSIWAVKKGIEYAKKPRALPTASQLQARYGSHSWVLVVDCKGNEQYCILLAQRGFSLILCGEEEDIKIAEDRVMAESGEINFKIEQVVIDWEKQAKNLKFYEELDHRLKDYDISMIIMPTIPNPIPLPTHQQKSPSFQHFFLITRHFAPKLKWRPTYSAIIIPSTDKIDKVDGQLNGVTRAVQSGVDAFGRILGYEMKGAVDVLVARGSAEGALVGLGKVNVTY